MLKYVFVLLAALTTFSSTGAATPINLAIITPTSIAISNSLSLALGIHASNIRSTSSSSALAENVVVVDQSIAAANEQLPGANIAIVAPTSLSINTAYSAAIGLFSKNIFSSSSSSAAAQNFTSVTQSLDEQTFSVSDEGVDVEWGFSLPAGPQWQFALNEPDTLSLSLTAPSLWFDIHLPREVADLLSDLFSPARATSVPAPGPISLLAGGLLFLIGYAATGAPRGRRRESDPIDRV